jgi:hypothetical protein
MVYVVNNVTTGIYMRIEKIIIIRRFVKIEIRGEFTSVCFFCWLWCVVVDGRCMLNSVDIIIITVEITLKKRMY